MEMEMESHGSVSIMKRRSQHKTTGQSLWRVPWVLVVSFIRTRWSRWLSKDEVQQWDTCPEPTELRLILLFDRVNLEPKIQIKYVDTKNRFADVLTTESFTRDEWNHLLRLFNMMSFSMFSCSHSSNFLSDPIGKQSAMSKRGLEATSSEGSPTSKPKPMVPAKTRPVNLV